MLQQEDIELLDCNEKRSLNDAARKVGEKPWRYVVSSRDEVSMLQEGRTHQVLSTGFFSLSFTLFRVVFALNLPVVSEPRKSVINSGLLSTACRSR